MKKTGTMCKMRIIQFTFNLLHENQNDFNVLSVKYQSLHNNPSKGSLKNLSSFVFFLTYHQ